MYAKHDPREESAPGLSHAPLDWKFYSVPVCLLWEVIQALGRNTLRRNCGALPSVCKMTLLLTCLPMVGKASSSAKERFDVTCDHCGGFWDRLFGSQEEADQWLVQHRAVCLTQAPPSLRGR